MRLGLGANCRFSRSGNDVITRVTTIIILCAVGACGLLERDEWIELASVPRAAIEAAEAAVDGIAIVAAEVEIEDGVTVYELEGYAQGIEYSIEVTAQGQIIEIEPQA